MPEDSSAVFPKGSSYPIPGTSFRKAPWFIIRDKSIKSHGASLVLSVLWCAIQGSRVPTSSSPPQEESKTCQITDKEIAKRSGVKCIRVVRRHLAHLEQIGYIKRHGHHKGRVIEFLMHQPDDNQGLNIPHHILESNKTPTQKLFSTLIKWLKKKKRKYVCEKLGISPRTYHRLNSERNDTSTLNILTLNSELFDTTIIGVVGEGFGEGIPSGIQGDESPEGMEERKMLRLKDHTPFTVSKSISKKQLDNTPVEKLIHPDTLVELIEEVFQNKHIRISQTHHTLYESSQVVEALKKRGGLSTLFTKKDLEYIVSNMSQVYKLPEQEIRAVLRRQFDEEARITLYENISNSMSLKYGGPGTNISLKTAARHPKNQGFSLIVYVCLKPPVLKNLKPPTPKIPKELEASVQFLKRYVNDFNPNRSLPILKKLYTYYQEDVSPFLRRVGAKGEFIDWFYPFVKSAYQASGENGNFHTGWLKPDGRQFQEWDSHFRKEIQFKVRTLSEGRAWAEAARKQAEKEKEENFREAYGIQ